MKANDKNPPQLVRNVGLFYVCYEFSKRGWNALPTSRNAKGIDIIAYSQDGNRTKSIQVKSLSARNPVPFGGAENLSLIADYVIICRKVFEERPEIFIMTSKDVIKGAHSALGKSGKSHWLEAKQYELFRDKWSKIGRG